MISSYRLRPKMTPEVLDSPQFDRMMKRRPYVVLLVLALISLLGVSAYFLVASHRQAVVAAEVETRNLVKVMELRVAADLARAVSVLDATVQALHVEALQPGDDLVDRAGLSGQMAALMRNFPALSAVNLFDASGWLLYSSRPATERFNIRDRPFFKRLQSDPQAGLIFSDAMVSRSTGHRAMVLIRAVRNAAGVYLGNLSAVINLDDYLHQFHAVQVGPQGVLLLRRSDTFKLMFRQPEYNPRDFNQPLPANNPIRQMIDLGAREGTLRYTASTDGQRRLGSFRVLQDYPFYVQVSLADAGFLAQWRQQTAVLGFLALLVLLGFVVLLVVVFRQEVRAVGIARQLTYREALFGALFQQSNFLAGVLDAEGRLLEVNDQALTVIGGRREELVGALFIDSPWWERDADRQALTQCLATAAEGRPCSIEVEHPLTGGSSISVLFHAIPLQSQGEHYIAVTGVDISASKQAQRALAQSEQRMALALRGGDLGLWDWHVPSGKVLFNVRWASMLGYAYDEIPAHLDSWSKLVHEDDWAVINAALQPHLRGETPQYESEHRMRHKDGHWVWVLDRGMVVERDAQGQAVRCIGTHMDITRRKRDDEALKLSEMRFRRLSESSPSGIWQADAQGANTYVSRRWSEITGISAQDALNTGWSDGVHPDDRNRVYKGWVAAANNQLSEYRAEFRFVHPSRGIVWVLCLAAPEMDASGHAGGWIGTITDISSIKQISAELTRSNAELEQFSYSISHDMRQPLRMISSYLQLIQMELEQGFSKEQQDYFRFATEGAQRLDAMMTGLLEYSRVGRKGEPPESCDCRELLDDALRILEPLITETGARVQVEGQWPNLFVRRDEILRLLQNLIGNALKFRVSDRPVEVTLSGVLSDDHWQLSVADNGVGVLPDQAHRLFQVFQRLQSRTSYEGNGIGLALCRKIVEHHGGHIGVESEGEGCGSRFIVDIPLSVRPAT
jgi:PAS domain S-box-containing protein